MNLYWKLFLALFASVLIGAGALALLSQWRLDRGFVDYVNAADAGRLPELAEVAAAIYAADGGWGEVERRPRRWQRALRDALRGDRPSEFDHRPPRGPPPPRRHPRPHDAVGADYDPPPPPRPRGPGPPHQGLPERIALLDASGLVLAGRSEPSDDMPSAPVLVDGVEVGRLVLAPARRPGSVQDTAFLLAQRDWLLRVVLIMLPIAALFAFLLARHLLAPVRAISTQARRLASGDFAARVPREGDDELGRLARDFNLLGRALNEYDGARKRWMADAAHELRTPLAVLQAEIEALQDGIRSVDSRALQGLHSQTVQLGTLVNDLHQLALADAGALDYRMHEVDVDSELISAVEAHRGRLEDAGLELRLLPATAIKARVMGDERRLRQLFDNLIENARRYTRAPGLLSISRERVAGCWQLHLDDSAPAVAADRCERLFSPFVRDDERLRADGVEPAGSGLGLAICRRIAQAHQGQISAAPSALGGLRVSLSIPLLDASQ